MNTPAGDLWTTKEAAHYLRVSTRSVARYVAHEGLPHILMGGTYRFRQASIDQWLTSREQTHPVKKKTPGRRRGRKPGSKPRIVKGRTEMSR